MKYRVGNLIDLAIAGEFDAIAHGCNIFNTFGSGIAAEIRERMPQVAEADARTIQGDNRKLGQAFGVLQMREADGSLFAVVNIYTQGSMGRRGVHVDYEALERGMYHLFMGSQMTDATMRIGIPKIGAGLGGGDWERIEAIIDSIPFEDITCVVLDEAQIPPGRVIVE